MHLVECGPEDGPVVVFCHGFPESWYSWRHQLLPMADAGYRAVALDMRGFGRSHKPLEVGAYTTLDHVGDVVGVLNAFEVSTAVIVGHDHGAPVAWTAATVRPDRFRAVVGLSVPLPPRFPVRPSAAVQELFGSEWFYTVWFDDPGVAEAVLDPNAEQFLRGFVYTLSGDCPGEPLRGLAGGVGGDIFSRLTIPDELPAWLTAEDLAVYVGEFERSGFRGGLNWYRCLDRNWELGRRRDPPRVRALDAAGTPRGRERPLAEVPRRAAVVVTDLHGPHLTGRHDRDRQLGRSGSTPARSSGRG
jgi:pimeloyl-ACP methyl ester carboxylesterase